MAGVWKKLISSASSIVCSGLKFSRRARPYNVVFQLCLRVDEPLGFVLQFDIGAQRVDTGAHAGLLQVSGLVKERLREINTRLCRFHIRGSAQAAEILRDHPRGALLAS